MSLKFSGTCFANIENHEIIECYDSYIIGQEEWVNEDIDFDYDILDQLKNNEKIKDLSDGTYYVYFCGESEFGLNYCYEYACDEPWSEHNLEQVFYQKMDDERGIKDITLDDNEKTIS